MASIVLAWPLRSRLRRRSRCDIVLARAGPTTHGRGRKRMIEASGIDHIVLHVSDVHRSKEFYTGLLGMTPYRENDRQVFLHAGSQGVALFKKGEGPPSAGGDLNHLALNVADGSYEPLKAE